MSHKTVVNFLLATAGLLLSLVFAPTAQAVPSFARQTGVSCIGCHTAFPQLTAFGRLFKIQGYTLTNAEQVKGDKLNIDLGAPLSMMLQTTWSHLKSAPDSSTDNSQTRLPSQLSIFYAGRITDKIGSFVQITSEDGGGFSQDNTDIRFADSTTLGATPVSYGVSLNNNPTVQDPWNSTPVWGFPWFEAGYGYEYPDALIGSLGGAVAGLTGYGFWNNHLYTELGAYESSNTGASTAADGNILKGGAPYWRIAYTASRGSMNWEVGALGMNATTPDDNKLTDSGIDAELQWALAGNQTLTLDTNYIHEAQSDSQHLNTMKADLTWYSNQTWGITVGYHGARSSDNPTVRGETTWEPSGGKLDTDAYQMQLDYTPWLNTRFALQYTDYAKLNGTTTDASNNNQLMVGAWLLF